MANACIAYTNLADTASVITATSANLLLPVSNVINPHIARKWRGAVVGGDSVIVDMGATVSFDTIAAFGLTGTTIALKASSVDFSGIAGDMASSGALTFDQNYKSQLYLLPSPAGARYFRFDLVGPSTVEIGRIFIGVRKQFAYNYVKGYTRTWNDLSLRTKTRGGQTQIFPDAVFRTYSVSFDFLKDSDRIGFIEDIDRVNALKSDVLFVTDPNSANMSRDSVWGLMSQLTPVVQPYVGTYTKSYQIEERL